MVGVYSPLYQLIDQIDVYFAVHENTVGLNYFSVVRFALLRPHSSPAPSALYEVKAGNEASIN